MAIEITLFDELKGHMILLATLLVEEEKSPYNVLELLDDSSADLGEDYEVDDLKTRLTVAQIAELQEYLKQCFEAERDTEATATINQVNVITDDPCEDPSAA